MNPFLIRPDDDAVTLVIVVLMKLAAIALALLDDLLKRTAAPQPEMVLVDVTPSPVDRPFRRHWLEQQTVVELRTIARRTLAEGARPGGRKIAMARKADLIKSLSAE